MTNEEKLKILIEAHNRANKAFEEVNKQVDKTEKRFSGLSDRLDKMGGKMKDVGGKMSTRFTLPIMAGAGLAVKAYSDLQETLNKVDVSFGNNAGTVKEWSKDSIKSMGLAQQSALDAAALFGDMGTGMGQNTKEASKMSMGLTQLGADMASFKNVSFDRAQTALAGIYTGETEALKGLGIVMTQTNLEEYARAEGIKKSMKEMSQAELVQLRYNYVMDKTKNAQGDFARTSDGIANQTRMTGERVKQLSAEFGEKLAPAYGRVLEIGNKVLDFFKNLTDGQQKALVVLALVVAAIGPVVIVIGHLITAIRGIGIAFSFLAAHPAILAVTAIILVVAGLAFLIYKNWGSITSFFAGIWSKVMEIVSGFVDWVSGVWNGVVNGIKAIWASISGFFSGLWQGIVNIFNGFVSFVKAWGPTILAIIFWPFALAVGLIIANWDRIKSFFSGVWAFIKAVFTPVIAWFVSIFTQALNGVKAIWNTVTGFFRSVWNGIVAIFSRVVSFYYNVFLTAWNMIKSVWNTVAGWFRNIFNGIVRVFSPIANWFGSVFRRAWGAVRSAFSGVSGFFRGVWNSIVSIFGRIGTSVGNAISSAFKSVINGVLRGATNIINGFVDAINGAIDLINKIPKVNIPKLGRLGVPSFYTGVRDFGGGIAQVGDVRGRGGEIIHAPSGTDVYSNRESKRILRALADGESIGGGGGFTFNNYGTIKNESAEASRAFWDRFNRMTELAEQGVPTYG